MTTYEKAALALAFLQLLAALLALLKYPLTDFLRNRNVPSF